MEILTLEKSPLEGASASVEPRPSLRKITATQMPPPVSQAWWCFVDFYGTEEVQCSEMLRINILKGNIGRHLSWSARQQSDKALTSPQQREGTRSN
jgi:hypothetical protein